MKRLIAIAALLLPQPVFAQTAATPGQTVNGTVPAAPVGHRQPTQGDVGSESGTHGREAVAPVQDLNKGVPQVCVGCGK